ncbi:hypothetical protein [Paenibacillus aceti]|uniref:Uncharacterized protein n=1 Tax=Paenibacillus aceti TaxID=1820010 RepID=A0ABQ1VZR9_9BACL|nr:hypothetical protein [Paenibacillus aceti]GGG06279.1 hypothetical protein GCM10010913_30170 [Paenibacillus aceti]
MKKILAILGIMIVVLGIVGLPYRYYHSLTPSMTADDIQMMGGIKPYDEDHLLVELEVNRLHDEPAHHFIYPIAKGLGNISFIHEDGLYAPNSVGTDYVAEEILINQMDRERSIDSIGFAIPDQQGKYKLKFTMQIIGDSSRMKDLALYYIHMEKKLGKDLSWVKKITLQR